MTEPHTPLPAVPYVPGREPQAEPLPPFGPPTAGFAPVSPAAPLTTGAVPVPGYAPPALPRRRTGLIVVLGVLAAIVLIGAGVVGALVATSGKSPVDAVKAVTGPKAFTVNGILTLQDSDGYTKSANCSGRRGYDDIAQGAQLTISDAAGATIAIGALGPGQVQTYGCVFSFSVPDVPAGKGFYGVEVAHRGVLKYTEAEISTKSLSLTLG